MNVLMSAACGNAAAAAAADAALSWKQKLL